MPSGSIGSGAPWIENAPASRDVVESTMPAPRSQRCVSGVYCVPASLWETGVSAIAAGWRKRAADPLPRARRAPPMAALRGVSLSPYSETTLASSGLGSAAATRGTRLPRPESPAARAMALPSARIVGPYPIEPVGGQVLGEISEPRGQDAAPPAPAGRVFRLMWACL